MVVFGAWPAAAQERVLVLEGGTLIDGTGRAPVPDAVILVEGGRIRAVGARGQVSYPATANVPRELHRIRRGPCGEFVDAMR